jgi:hypothetical protein
MGYAMSWDTGVLWAHNPNRLAPKGPSPMKEFKAAARASEDEEEKVLEFAIGEQEFRSKIPSTARTAMFIAAMTDEASTGEAVGAIFAFLKDMLLDDGYRRIRKLITDEVIDLGTLTGGGDENDDGIIDWIISQASDNRPTPPSADSSSSPETGGRRSTGRSPGKGSTRLASLSPVS